MVHELKIWPNLYERIVSGEKNFEARINDRGFQKGDVLRLKEYDPITETYTGNNSVAEVGFVLTGEQFGIIDGYCVMSLITPIKEKFIK